LTGRIKVAGKDFLVGKERLYQRQRRPQRYAVSTHTHREREREKEKEGRGVTGRHHPATSDS
jgi:hypothetical protein